MLLVPCCRPLPYRENVVWQHQQVKLVLLHLQCLKYWLWLAFEMVASEAAKILDASFQLTKQIIHVPDMQNINPLELVTQYFLCHNIHGF